MSRSRAGLLLVAVLMMPGCGDPGRDAPVDAGAASAGGAAPAAGEWRTGGCPPVPGPSAPGTPPATASATPPGTAPATPPELSAAMSRIEQGGRARFPDSYAGLEVDEPQARAIVYRVPSAPFDDFVRESAGGACVVVRDAAHSGRELSALQERISADLAFWNARRVRISSVGARHDGAGVEVGTQDVALARTELLRRYGAGAPIVFVEAGPVVPLRTAGLPPAAQPGG